MSARHGVLAGGNWIVDKLKVVDAYPRQDALANIISESTGNGGSSFNVLVALAMLEAPFPLEGVGLIGEDADGAWIRERCRELRIADAALRTVPGAHTSYTDVFTVQSTGRRTFFHQRGASALLGPEHFDFSTTPAKILHLGYLLLLDKLDQEDTAFGTVAARVLAAATQAGLKTSIDVVSEEGDRFARLVRPALRHVDFCIINEFEAERITGIPIVREGPPDSAALRRASEQLLAAGVRELVLIHFPAGATALTRDGAFLGQGSLRVPQEKIVSTVGAGDAFAAGALVALHAGASPADVLIHGVSAAAACLFGGSTSDGLRRMAECLALGAQLGFRSFA